MAMRRTYLDNNATTPVLPEVLDAMRPYSAEHFGNASSHPPSWTRDRAAVERPREAVTDFTRCGPSASKRHCTVVIWNIQAHDLTS